MAEKKGNTVKLIYDFPTQLSTEVFDGKEWKGEIINYKQNVTASGEVLLEGNKLKIVAHKAFITKTIYWDVVK